MKKRCGKAVNFLKETYAEIRVGRANPQILNKVMIDYYGVKTPISQISSVTVPEARQLLIQPWDATQLKNIERAIIEADLGINPQNDGKCIRLIFPDLTEERRIAVSKELKEEAEKAKISVRNTRREAVDFSKNEQKEGNISEDDEKRNEDEIQKLTDKFIGIIDSVYEEKEREVMTV